MPCIVRLDKGRLPEGMHRIASTQTIVGFVAKVNGIGLSKPNFPNQQCPKRRRIWTGGGMYDIQTRWSRLQSTHSAADVGSPYETIPSICSFRLRGRDDYHFLCPEERHR